MLMWSCGTLLAEEQQEDEYPTVITSPSHLESADTTEAEAAQAVPTPKNNVDTAEAESAQVITVNLSLMCIGPTLQK